MTLGLWGVVNNAGTLDSIGLPDWLTADDYRRQCDVNLFGPVDVTMTFLPLVKHTRGRIVNMSSNFALVSNPLFAAYSVSKFGVEAFTDALRYKALWIGCLHCCAYCLTSFSHGSGLPNMHMWIWSQWTQHNKMKKMMLFGLLVDALWWLHCGGKIL